MNKMELTKDINRIQQTLKERIVNVNDKDFETGAMFGFNVCLEMIKQDTNIDWGKVKQKNPDFNMARWFQQMSMLARSYK